MDKKQIKIAKLAIEADGNIIGESFVAKPEKDLASKLGVLFGVIEMYNVDDNFSHKLLEAVSDLKTEFYLPPYGTQSTPEKRFEESLARANRRLFSAFSESIEPIDLRNINVTIGLSRKNEVYLSQIGHGKAFLFHRKKNWEMLVLDILSDEDRPAEKPNPEKLFSSVLSGAVGENDGLLVCNEEFLGYFSQNELARTIDEHAPDEALKYLGDQIREKVAKANFYAIAIKPEQKEKLLAEDISQSKPITSKSGGTQTSINKLLNTRAETEKYLAPSMMPNWQKALIISGGWLKKAGSVAFAKTSVAAVAVAKLAKDKLNQSKANKKIERVQETEVTPIPQPEIDSANDNQEEEINYNDFPTEKAEEQFEVNEKITSDFKVTEEIESIQSPTEKITHLATPAKPAKVSSGKISNLINDWINDQIVKFLSLKLSQRVVLALALVLLFLFSQSIVWIGRAEESSSNRISSNNKAAQEIQRLIDNAEAQNIFNDEVGAMASIKKARETLEEIPDRWGNKDLRRQLTEKIDSTYRRLQKITVLDSSKELINLGEGNYIGLARTTGLLWCFNNSTKELVSIEESGSAKRFASQIPDISKLSAIDDRYLAVLAQDNSFYRYEVPKDEAVKTKPGKDYFTVKYPTPSPLLDPPLTASSTIRNISSGEYHYILDKDNGRIVILDKNGAIKKQYYSEKIKVANSLIANTKDKKLWFLSGSSIYEIDTEI